MRQLVVTICLLGSLQLTGQDNFYPSNFEKQPGTKTVIVKTDCPTCKPILIKEHSETYIFDSNGFNIEQHGVRKGVKSGMFKFFWNPDGTLAKYQNYGTFISTIGAEEANAENDFGMIWDSTRLSNELIYTYENKKIKTITWIDGNDLSISSLITFYYDENWQIIKEEIINYLGESELELGFKPNSTEVVKSAGAKKQAKDFKLLSYSQGTVSIKYYKAGKLSGTGTRIFNKHNHLTNETTFNSKGEIVFWVKNKYNDEGRLTEQRRFETGYDGYGNGGAYAGGDKIIFEYDTSQRSKRKLEYYKGDILTINYYDYN